MSLDTLLARKTPLAAVPAAILAASLLAPVPARADAESYVVDTEHTAITFSIRHFFSRVPGRFATFDGAILLDQEDFTNGSVTFSIDTASIDTNDDARDKHLRSDDFFDADNHPKITFQSTRVRKADENKLQIDGDLTIRGITKSVTLAVDVLGFGSFYGAERAAFEARLTIDRHDFKVSWNDVVEGGGLILGDEVEIVINLEARKLKKAPATATASD